MKTYLSLVDAIIEDQGEPSPGFRSKLLLDPEGNLIWRFPGDWTENQIRIALEFANHTFGIGHARGWASALREVRKALGIQEDT